jgi:hypothetical protein
MEQLSSFPTGISVHLSSLSRLMKMSSMTAQSKNSLLSREQDRKKTNSHWYLVSLVKRKKPLAIEFS